MKPYLIIGGCMKSGTTYMANVLRSVGLDVGHEQAGQDAAVGWPLLLPEHPAYKRAMESSDNIFCFRQIRHPLRIVESMVVRWDWTGVEYPLHVPEASKYIDYDISEPKILKYMRAVAGLYNVPATRDWKTFQIEQLPQVWPYFLRLFGLEQQPLPPTDHINTNRGRGFYTYPRLTWPQLMEIEPDVTRRLMELGAKHGYTRASGYQTKSRYRRQRPHRA